MLFLYIFYKEKIPHKNAEFNLKFSAIRQIALYRASDPMKTAPFA